MTGNAGKSQSDINPDSRINNDLNDFSNKTGVDMDILSNYTAINHVNVPIESGTAYEYLANKVDNSNLER